MGSLAPDRLLHAIGATCVVLGMVLGFAWVTAMGAAFILAVFALRPTDRRPDTALAEPLTPSSTAVEIAPILDAMPLPLIQIDRRGVIARANSAARAAFPGCREGMAISGVIRAPDILQAIDTVLSSRRMRVIDLVERVPVERSYAVTISPLPDGGSEGAIILAVDTSEARRVEAARVDFVANASHELRTPLASILGFVETLEGPARDDAAARGRFLGIIRQQAQRMARLVEDLLSLSRIEMRAHIRPTDPVDLGLLLRQLADSLGGIARERKVQLVMQWPEGTDAMVTGDRDELMRLFENLIENAIKYGQSGGKVDITMVRREGAGDLTVSVRDYGPGIAPEHLPRLTERFYRADVQESRILGGTGLGLALVKHIASRHGARLAIESEPGQGAKFSITLPYRNLQGKTKA